MAPQGTGQVYGEKLLPFNANASGFAEGVVGEPVALEPRNPPYPMEPETSVYSWSSGEEEIFESTKRLPHSSFEGIPATCGYPCETQNSVAHASEGI